MKNGGCPICHRYFLVFYILREHGLIDLIVTTFLPESPPKEVLEFSNGKRYPLVKVRSGLDSRGQNISGIECDTVDEIEVLLDRFDCDQMRSRKESSLEASAEQAFEDLYMVSSSHERNGKFHAKFNTRNRTRWTKLRKYMRPLRPH
jgi:chloride intracellular channel protein 2